MTGGGGGLVSLARRCLESGISRAALPGVLVAVFPVTHSGLSALLCSALLQWSSIGGMMATGYVCFWWGFCHRLGNRCLRVKGWGEEILRISMLKCDLFKLLYRALYNNEKCTVDGDASSYCRKNVCSVPVARKICVCVCIHVPGDVSFVQRNSPAACEVLSSQRAGGILKPSYTQVLGVFGCWFSGETCVSLWDFDTR